MGHIHLATLPGTKPWGEVVRLLDERAGAEEIVSASAMAAEKELATAARSLSLIDAVQLLALVPQAARGDDFAKQLRGLGMDVPDAPMLGDLTLGLAAALDLRQSHVPRNDFDKIVRGALVGTLSARIGDSLPGLFEAEAGDVQGFVAQIR